MATLGPMSQTMRRAAISQDKIGWREFTEGKILKDFAWIQRAHCAGAPWQMNGDDWTKHFISHILQISHSQWIFRNITLHDKVRGTLRLKERKEVLKEVGQLIETDPADVPMESRFLLEFDFDSLYRTSFEKQTYWVRAIKAACRAGRRTTVMQFRRGTGVHRRAAKRKQTLPYLDTSHIEEQMNAELTLRPSTSRRRANSNQTDIDNPCHKRYRRPA